MNEQLKDGKPESVNCLAEIERQLADGDVVSAKALATFRLRDIEKVPEQEIAALIAAAKTSDEKEGWRQVKSKFEAEIKTLKEIIDKSE